jgi:hypothetical protein
MTEMTADVWVTLSFDTLQNKRSGHLDWHQLCFLFQFQLLILKNNKAAWNLTLS